MQKEASVRIEFVSATGQIEIKKSLNLEAGEVLESMRMSVTALRDFFENSLQECKDNNVMWSLHVKATMMKISHPIVFGHAVTVFYKDLFAKHGTLFADPQWRSNVGRRWQS